MKGIFLPLLAITAVLAVTGIQIFQVDPVDPAGSKTAEAIYVIMLAVLIGLGILIAAKRSKEIKKGLPVEDELSRHILNRAGSVTFFVSLLIWLILLYVEVHGLVNMEAMFLFAYGLIASCFVFLISWTTFNFGGAGHEKQD